MKRILMTSMAGLLIGACTSTVGTSPELAPLLVTNQAGDGDLSCEQLAAEIQRMDTIMAQAMQSEANAETSGAVAGTATNAAVNTALYSGALSRVPGLGFAANAAGGIAQQQAKAQAERAAENARRAELRKTALVGVSTGKGC